MTVEDEGYLTAGTGQAELEIRKSKFIGNITHVESEEDAKAFIEKISANYRDATHNVYCYILKQGAVMRFSDAGEPSGTAGKPALDAMQNAGITNFCLVITRYFGGIKLGAGGLARAYRASARHTLDIAGVVRMVITVRAVIESDYSDWSRLEALLSSFDATLGEIQYTEKIRAEVFIAPSETDKLSSAIADLSRGQGRFEIKEYFYKGEPSNA